MQERVFVFNNGVFIGETVLSLYEGLYLLEKQKIIVFDVNGKELKLEDFLKNKKIRDRYIIYKFLKEKNIRFGAGLKFGGTFRVYENPKDEHSRWVCFPVNKEDKIIMYDFLAKNRVAHSTRKNLLIAIVDDKIRLLEIKWKKL